VRAANCYRSVLSSPFSFSPLRAAISPTAFPVFLCFLVFFATAIFLCFRHSEGSVFRKTRLSGCGCLRGIRIPRVQDSMCVTSRVSRARYLFCTYSRHRRIAPPEQTLQVSATPRPQSLAPRALTVERHSEASVGMRFETMRRRVGRTRKTSCLMMRLKTTFFLELSHQNVLALQRSQSPREHYVRSHDVLSFQRAAFKWQPRSCLAKPATLNE